MIMKTGVSKRDKRLILNHQQIMCVKRYCQDYKSTWKTIIDYYLINCCGKFLFQCNFDESKLQVNIKFYRGCFKTFASLKPAPNTATNVAEEIIRNNKQILVENKMIYRTKH